MQCARLIATPRMKKTAIKSGDFQRCMWRFDQVDRMGSSCSIGSEGTLTLDSLGELADELMLLAVSMEVRPRFALGGIFKNIVERAGDSGSFAITDEG